ncbi:unnamed protein product [Tilletia controversa]|uniref:Major facilitator superfamily (MFS) profile domain-containing protein n=3 Tax=Tilletia TaxID=13289 RepID=A0A8X7SVM5_9BASI|nr:hypothetical protein CF336_g3557 [Tilletia laevis]KAE8199460.1 hypothetical protein CF328_g3237 [Tilletia controversa]KAE8259005.1 hypothetical protein A4X03_0g4220 [Tilletia caries]KAE8204312.1 hypothetical protein CF335_g2695 [Tilletia laevis]KAE8245686.1 hypothetical protein A4X06_0g5495 [Tilletia controversa]
MSSSDHTLADRQHSQDIEKGHKHQDSATEATAISKPENSVENTPQADNNAPTPTPAPAAPRMPTFPDGGLKAWSVVFGAFLAMCVTLGTVISFTVFQEYYFRVTLSNQSQDAIAWIGSVQLACSFGMTLPAGMLNNRFGPRITIAIGAVLVVLGNMTASVAKEYYQFFLSQGLCAGFGYGFVMLPALATPSEWFLAKRGLATALAIGGSSIGGVIIPVMVNRLLNSDDVSLGWTLRAIAFVQLGALIVAIALIQDRFPKAGLALPIKEYFGTRATNFFMLGGMFVYLGQYIPFSFITPYGVYRGTSPNLAFYYASILNGSTFAGRLALGTLADRVTGHFNTVAATALITGLLAFVMTAASDNAGIIVWAVFYGFFSGAIQSLFTPGLARLAGSPQKISGFLAIGSSLMWPFLLASEPIAGKLLQDTGNTNFVGMTIFAGSVCMAGSVMLVISRVLVPGAKGFKV